jgi:hypothetical protein
MAITRPDQISPQSPTEVCHLNWHCGDARGRAGVRVRPGRVFCRSYKLGNTCYTTPGDCDDRRPLRWQHQDAIIQFCERARSADGSRNHRVRRRAGSHVRELLRMPPSTTDLSTELVVVRRTLRPENGRRRCEKCHQTGATANLHLRTFPAGCLSQYSRPSTVTGVVWKTNVDPDRCDISRYRR